MLDDAGFPRACEFLPGNVSEGKTLQDAVRRFEAQGHGEQGIKPTVVMDAGISAQENLDWLTAQGYPWICVAKGHKPSLAPRRGTGPHPHHPSQPHGACLAIGTATERKPGCT